ncbi:MAG: HDOD domain-containing protein [Proteobacteria bacterium]|nr:HDOD domain-containing protein [Pseudomonadota bacterium]
MQIENIIKKIDMLKPVSYLGEKIMEITRDPNSSLAELVEIIKYDQSMTANLLRICNSSFFGLKKEIASIHQALAYLGIERVACLVMMGNSAHNFMTAQQGYDLNEGELWRNSVSSALIAQDLAEKRRLNNVPLIFTAALLKDIGKVVLNNYVQDSFKDIMALVQEKGISFIDAEKEIIGIDHAELGAKVAERWNFSPAMINIIRNHHNPDRASEDDLSIPIVYLADSICMMIGIGVGADGLSYRYYQEILDRLNFTDVDLQKTIAEFWEKLKGVEELVKLSRGER